MLLPLLHPGIKECHPLSRRRIFPINMRPFASIAVRACQRRICHIRLATPRPRYNVVKLKAAHLELGRQLTVFTAMASSPDDRVTECLRWRAHASDNTPGSAVRRRSRATRASSFSIVRRWEKATFCRNRRHRRSSSRVMSGAQTRSPAPSVRSLPSAQAFCAKQ